MKKTVIILLFVAALFLGLWAQAQQQQNRKYPCQDPITLKEQRLNFLNGCISGWTRQFGPNDPDPNDDCMGRMKAFVDAARAAKQCNQRSQKLMRH